jgi:hypothetical protein
MRKVMQHPPVNLFLWLLSATLLYPVTFAVNASESNPPTTSRYSKIPRTLKEADMGSTEIIGQSPGTPAAPSPSTPSTPAIPTAPYPPIPVRGGASFASGPGVGYESSFFGLDGFFPIIQTPGKNLTYVQGRLLLDTNGGNPGGNFALGYRDFDPTTGRILGGYAAFDVRDTGNTTFSQLGAGVEAVLPGGRVSGEWLLTSRRSPSGGC